MLIYSKKVDGKMRLFGTEGNVPSASDEQLTYKDNAGNVIDVDDLHFFYSKKRTVYGGESKRQIPNAEEDKKCNVWLGDELILGDVVTHNITHNTITHVAISVAGSTTSPIAVPEGATVVLSIAARSGYEFVGEPEATANGTAVTLTETEGTYTANLTANEDIAVVVTATVQQQE